MRPREIDFEDRSVGGEGVLQKYTLGGRGADRRASTRRRPSAGAASQAGWRREPWPRRPRHAGRD